MGGGGLYSHLKTMEGESEVVLFYTQKVPMGQPRKTPEDQNDATKMPPLKISARLSLPEKILGKF